MSNLTVWLLAMVQPLITRILIVLGLSVVSFTGTTVAINAFATSIEGAWNGIPAAMLSLMHLAGIHHAMSIIGSAIATRLFIASVKASGAFLAKTPS